MTFQEIMHFSLGAFTVQKLLFVIAVAVVGILLVKLITRAVRHALGKTRLDVSVQTAIVNVVRFLLYLIVVLLLADALGIPVTSLVAILSVAGLAVSLAIQDTLSNVFSGVILLLNKPFVSGDYVQIGALEGKVIKVNLMNTQLCTLDNKTVFIPNKDANSSAIVNFTGQATRRVEIRVCASYEDETEAVKAALYKAVEATPGVLSDPPPFVALSAYQNSSIEYLVWAWTPTEKYWTTYFTLNEAIRTAFEANGVTMTFDHLNVHIDR